MQEDIESVRLAELDYEEEQLTDNKSVSMPRWQWRALRHLAYRQDKSLSKLITETTRPLVEDDYHGGAAS
jgi:hypothetical protein